jgi:polyferredoxin
MEGAFMAKLKKIVRYGVIPLYLALFFAGVLSSGYPGLAVNFALLFVGMWAFVDRRLPVGNYLLAALFMAFYLLLFWTEAFTPVAAALGLPTKWTLYGALYTVLVLVFGALALSKYRRDRYQVVRTISVMGVQLVLAFLIPLLLPLAGHPEYYFSYLWPLKIEYFYPEVFGSFPLPYVVYGFAGALAAVPVLALVLGKRWYCSWVCGCGGLAETFGDRWRHLSNKSRTAWRFEMVSVHLVLLVATAGTALVLLDWFFGGARGAVAGIARRSGALGPAADRFRSLYGFLVSGVLAGVVGVGFYPTLGSRVWCRFFCPMAALLGLVGRKGRFWIRVKKDMCISCGACSTYCEMGIDVRAYAQRNESFRRLSCVGCGICAHVCPRGVLRLENTR